MILDDIYTIKKMKKVLHQFAVEFDWVEEFSKALDGFKEGSRIYCSSEIFQGIRYVSSINSDISVMLTDGMYMQDISFELKNLTDDFVWIWYNLNDGNSQISINDLNMEVGRSNFNSLVVDGGLEVNYNVKKNTNTFSLIIFIKKDMIKRHLVANDRFKKVYIHAFDIKKNTIFSTNRMSTESLFLIEEFREQIKSSNEIADLFLAALAFNLISDYLDNYFMKQNIILTKMDITDIEAIIDSQSYILDNIKKFAGIKNLSEHAKMSETKYKKIFLKITGLTPYLFYQNNKLRISKELLESQKYNVGEIVEILNFPTPSLFAKQFKNSFGMTPKEYMLLIS